MRLLIPLLLCSFFIACSKEDIITVPFPDPDVDLTVPAPETNVEVMTDLSKDDSYKWLIGMMGVNGLMESSEHSNFVSLYDNALSAILFIRNNDRAWAERILDFFNTRMEHELMTGSGGFYQYRDLSGDNGSRTWIGDNAWLLIAINMYHEITGKQQYSEMANALEDWLRSLQDQDGGLWGGRNADGSQIPKVTEGILTAFHAVKGYDDFHKNILTYLNGNRWDVTHQILTSWPENPEYQYALDLHSLGQLILADFPIKNLELAETLYLSSHRATVTGQEVSGYCFDEDKDVIWLEGTGQMAVAYRDAGYTYKAEGLLTELDKTQISSAMTINTKGIPYTANYGTTYGSALLWDHTDSAPAISSTVWYLFAKIKLNPLHLGKKKNIPESDKFWIPLPN